MRLIKIPGGAFRMGSVEFYAEEAPVAERAVPSFRIGRAPVTNAEFAAFVAATGYVTVAERPVRLPGQSERAPGSLVFVATAAPVDLRDWRQWWRWVEGADWRHPYGPDSSLTDRQNHPVVQVAREDAEAFCAWAQVRLPTEAEWEYAARGGLDGARYVWGDEDPWDGELKANTWQGAFPYRNTGARGWQGTSPVGLFPPNGYGLVDVAGNVWEMTASPWTRTHQEHDACSCGPAPSASQSGSYVAKGGSHLCSPDYCFRFRPAARSSQTPDSATTHLGFRVAADL